MCRRRRKVKYRMAWEVTAQGLGVKPEAWSLMPPAVARRIVIVAAVGALSVACRGAAPQAALVEQDRIAMGSSLRVSIWTADEDRATKAIDAVYAEFERLEDALSIWRPGSDVQRLNAAAGEGPVPVGADILQVLEEA